MYIVISIKKYSIIRTLDINLFRSVNFVNLIAYFICHLISIGDDSICHLISIHDDSIDYLIIIDDDSICYLIIDIIILLFVDHVKTNIKVLCFSLHYKKTLITD